MIEFLTLFLAVAWGERTVEVTVHPTVAAVEFRLNGETRSRVEGPPWQANIQFGMPAPIELTAVAFDAAGAEVDRVSQRINFGPFLAEARLLLLREGDAPPTQARLIWETFDHREPKRIQARFDGHKVQLQRTEEGALIAIPPHDNEFPHLLEAELEFRDKIRTRADLPFGGRYGDRVSSDLTAVPILLPDGMALPTPQGAAGWLQAHGKALPVFAVRQEPALLVIVRDHFLRQPLQISAEDKEQLKKVPKAVTQRDDVYFQLTVPQLNQGGDHPTAIFGHQLVRRAQKKAGMDFVIRHLGPQGSYSGEPQRLVDAMVAAGQSAAQSGRPRAVVLLIDEASDDASQIPPQHAAGYLKTLHIPTFVWSLGDGSPSPTVAAFHQSGDYSPRSAAAMLTALDRNLRRQVIIWLEGRHLPQDIHLSPSTPPGVQLP